MNKLALATILLIIAFIVFTDDTSEPIGFYDATGVIKTISSSDFKKLVKLDKLIKKEHSNWIELFPVGF